RGDPGWKPRAASQPAALGGAPVGKITFAPPAATCRRAEWVTPSSLDEGRRVDAAGFFARRDPLHRKIGLLHHAWYAAVEWLDDGVPPDAALEELAVAHGYGGDDLAEQVR